VLIGGLATSYRSQPRFTKDIDFLVQVPQPVLPRLLEDLHGRGFEFETLAVIGEWTQYHMETLSYHGIRVDWLKPLIPAYLHILQLATGEAWLDRPIRIASAEGLILLNLLAFRTQDQVDIENLVAAKLDQVRMAEPCPSRRFTHATFAGAGRRIRTDFLISIRRKELSSPRTHAVRAPHLSRQFSVACGWVAASLGRVKDPKLHPPPFVTAEHAREVGHRERTTIDDENRTVSRSIPVNVTAKNVVA
jgi:hypothetical protein